MSIIYLNLQIIGKYKQYTNYKMENNKTIKDLKNLVIINPVEIKLHGRSAAHCAAISKSKKEFYASEVGLKERKLRSERTKKYWASEEGQAKKERLRAKYKGVKKTKI